jgi:hypothetical protein
MKTLPQISSILLLISSTFSFHLTAEIYTWTDKEGKVHFSDKPIATEKVTTIQPNVNENIANAVTKDSQWQQDYKKTKEAKAQQAKKNSQQARENKIYCNQLKSEMATIDQGGRLYVMTPEGEREFQSEAQLKVEKKRLTKAYKKTCR